MLMYKVTKSRIYTIRLPLGVLGAAVFDSEYIPPIDGIISSTKQDADKAKDRSIRKT